MLTERQQPKKSQGSAPQPPSWGDFWTKHNFSSFVSLRVTCLLRQGTDSRSQAQKASSRGEGRAWGHAPSEGALRRPGTAWSCQHRAPPGHLQRGTRPVHKECTPVPVRASPLSHLYQITVHAPGGTGFCGTMRLERQILKCHQTPKLKRFSVL